MGRELFVVKGMEKPDWPTKKKKKGNIFSFFFPTEFYSYKQNSKPFTNLQKNYVSAAYSVFPNVLFFISCHHILVIHHGCLTESMIEKALKYGMSFSLTRFFIFKLKANYSLKTTLSSLDLRAQNMLPCCHIA